MKRKNQILFLVWMLLFPILPIYSQALYFGVWQKGAGTNVISKFDNYADFVADGNEKAQNGLRLIDFDHFKNGRKDQFVGVWRTLHGAQHFVKFRTWKAFLADKQERAKKGMLLVDFESYAAKGRRNFVGVYREGTGNNTISRFHTWNGFVADGNQKAKRGLRLLDFEYFLSGGIPNYVGIWRKGSGTNLITRSNSFLSFMQVLKEKKAQGLKLVDFETFKIAGQRKFVGVWRNGTRSNLLITKGTWDAFVADGIERAQKGFRLLDFEAYAYKIPTSPPDSGPDSDPDTDPTPEDVSCNELPEVPYYVEIDDDNDNKVIVDFTMPAFAGENTNPTITIPRSLLEDLPTCNDGNIIFPTNFCGLRLTHVARFVWIQQGQVLGDLNDFHPTYTSIPENASLQQIDEPLYLHGLEFSGPIGACESNQDQWNFPATTKEGNLDPTDTDVRLVLEFDPGARLEFFNSNFSAEPLELGELFELADFEDIVEAAMALLEELDLREYVQAVCEEAPIACPVDDPWW